MVLYCIEVTAKKLPEDLDEGNLHRILHRSFYRYAYKEILHRSFYRDPIKEILHTIFHRDLHKGNLASLRSVAKFGVSCRDYLGTWGQATSGGLGVPVGQHPLLPLSSSVLKDRLGVNALWQARVAAQGRGSWEKKAQQRNGSLIHPSFHPSIQSFIACLLASFLPSFIHSSIPFIHSFIHSIPFHSIHSFIYFIHSFIHFNSFHFTSLHFIPFIHSFIHSFISFHFF